MFTVQIFLNIIGKYEIDYNVRFGGQLISEVERFDYLDSVVRENWRVGNT